MLITDAIEEYLAAKKNAVTHDTYAWYAILLDQFQVWSNSHSLVHLNEIKPTHISQYVADTPSKNTHTRHGRAQVVKSFLQWCAEDDEMGVKDRTVKRIEMPKIEQSEIILFTDSEMRALFKACNQMRNPHRNNAIVHTLLDTGVRASELCYDATRPEEETGLLSTNLFLGRDDSYIRVMGKGRKPRSIGLGTNSSSALRRYLNRERGHSPSPYVFLSRGDEPLSVRMLQQFLHQLGTLAHVDDCHPHRFRHTFAVSQLMHGTSDLVLMQLMGHTTLESTKIYTRAMTSLQARQASSSPVDHLNARRKHTY
jgi:site-specific recombinase XerD